MDRSVKDRKPKLKICGMKFPKNMLDIAALQPDYMGFIFWEHSSRFLDGNIPPLPKHIKKTGVFVDAALNTIISTVKKHRLQAVQLHGKENLEYCEALHEMLAEESIEIIKAFSVKDRFDFKRLENYEPFCHYFLFDTWGKWPGGNGVAFDWAILNAYPLQKPLFLSGGIGIEAFEDIRKLLDTHLPIYAIDVNSRFEIKAGYKDSHALKKGIKLLYSERKNHDISRR